jgi:hypothetical protein
VQGLRSSDAQIYQEQLSKLFRMLNHVELQPVPERHLNIGLYVQPNLEQLQAYLWGQGIFWDEGALTEVEKIKKRISIRKSFPEMMWRKLEEGSHTLSDNEEIGFCLENLGIFPAYFYLFTIDGDGYFELLYPSSRDLYKIERGIYVNPKQTIIIPSFNLNEHMPIQGWALSEGQRQHFYFLSADSPLSEIEKQMEVCANLSLKLYEQQSIPSNLHIQNFRMESRTGFKTWDLQVLSDKNL